MNVGRNKKEIYEEENRDFISHVFVDGREQGKHSFFTAEYYPIFRVCKEENWEFILNVSFRYSWTEEKKSTAEHYPNYLEYAKKKDFVSNVSFREIEERKQENEKVESVLRSIFDAEKEENRDFIQNVSFRATILQRKKADEKRRSTRSSLLNIRHLCKEENRGYYLECFVQRCSWNGTEGRKREGRAMRKEKPIYLV